MEALKVWQSIELFIFHLVSFFKENKLLLGFSLSTSLKNSFTWSKAEFEKYGIDIKGLKGDEERIYANRQSLKRFLETKGATAKYDQIINDENRNAKVFSVIDNFYKWIEKNKTEIQLPFGLAINSISKKYLPFEDELIKSNHWKTTAIFFTAIARIPKAKIL
ncbi:MAG: hypothetical protein IPK94_04815 [Saprospiraceae bacterium]|nr:hypothetical protein [Saprospiraceae bacterium]